MMTVAVCVVLILALLAVLSASTAAAAPGQGAWGDRENDHGYNSPDVISTVGAWDRDVLGFEVGVTQNQIYSGDRFSVIIDANRDGIEDYALVLYCCPLQKNMGYWTGSGWNFSIPQNTFQASFGSGTMQAYVHRGEVGWPQGALHFRARTWWEGSGQRPFDLAPDSGWFVLPQETAVGGASGPGAQTAPSSGPAPAAAPVATPEPAAAPPALDPAKGRAAIRALVRRRLGRRARVTRLSCNANVRCALRARRGTQRYRGSARVRALVSGVYQASFTGRRSDVRCPRTCGARVRWGWAPGSGTG